LLTDTMFEAQRTDERGSASPSLYSLLPPTPERDTPPIPSASPSPYRGDKESHADCFNTVQELINTHTHARTHTHTYTHTYTHTHPHKRTAAVGECSVA
jgi:hypothetical protein